MSTTYRVYRRLLRLPAFRGKSRVEDLFRLLLRPTVTTLPDGLQFVLDPHEWLQIEIAQDGGLEPLTRQLIESLLEPGDTFIDVGAHIGYLALTAARCVGSTGRVVAIDPQPYNCDRILVNASLNRLDGITVYVAAAGDRDGLVSLAHQGEQDKARLSLTPTGGVNDTPQKFVVPLRRVDGIVSEQEIQTVKVLKIDVEGFELEVLQGAEKVLSSTQHVVLEVLPTTDEEKTRRVAEHLRGFGYELRTVSGTPWVPEGPPPPESNVWGRRLTES